MAISINNQPLLHAPGFGRNIFDASIGANIDRVKLTLLVDDNPIGVQYSPAYNGVVNFSLSGKFASFSLSGLYTALLDEWTSPLSTGVIDTDLHRVRVRELFEEEGSGTLTDTSTGRTVYKAMDTGFGDRWTGPLNATNALGITGDSVKRLTKSGAIVPISVWRGDPSSALDLSIDGSVFATMPADGRHFSVLSAEIEGVGKSSITGGGIELDLYFKQGGHTLYWLSPYGGWDWYVFDSVDRKGSAQRQEWIGRTEIWGERTPRSYVREYREEVLYKGSPVNREWKEHLKTLLISPVILDEDGNRLQLLSDSVVYDEREFNDINIELYYIPNEFTY